MELVVEVLTMFGAYFGRESVSHSRPSGEGVFEDVPQLRRMLSLGIYGGDTVAAMAEVLDMTKKRGSKTKIYKQEPNIFLCVFLSNRGWLDGKS